MSAQPPAPVLAPTNRPLDAVLAPLDELAARSPSFIRSSLGEFESEICLHAFHGIITLHSDDTSDGLYGFVSRDVLSEFLLEPALASAERFLPRNQARVIDGFPAANGIINRGYHGMLQAPPGLPQPPFEITPSRRRTKPHWSSSSAPSPPHCRPS